MVGAAGLAAAVACEVYLAAVAAPPQALLVPHARPPVAYEVCLAAVAAVAVVPPQAQLALHQAACEVYLAAVAAVVVAPPQVACEH